MSRVRSKVWSLVLVLGLLACGSEGPEGPVLRAPGAPRNVSVVPGDGQATVSWEAPVDDGGSAILSYSVRALRGEAVAKVQESQATSVTVTGLTNGEEYSFVVTASNAQGEGAASAASASARPRTIPGAPRNVTATPGDRQVTVTWTAPTEPGMPITGYVLTVRQGDTVVATQQASGLTATASGLTNGTSYFVTVSASNAVVAGPESAPVAVMPRTTPAAPQVTLDVGVASLKVFWTAPDNGGLPITGYTVTLSANGEVVRTEQTSELTFNFLGLTNGTEYSVVVEASNAAGRGAPSETKKAMPCGYPTQPTNLFATPGNGEVDLTWNPPADAGGCAIRQYVVDTQGPNSLYLRAFTTEQGIKVTGLQNGVSYSFSVMVQTTGWSESDRASTTSTPRTVPGVPGNFVATPADGAVQLSWVRPTDEGGTQILAYQVTVEPGGRSIRVSGSADAYRVEGLTNGTAYTFTIVARNGAGDGQPATAQATPTAP